MFALFRLGVKGEHKVRPYEQRGRSGRAVEVIGLEDAHHPPGVILGDLLVVWRKRCVEGIEATPSAGSFADLDLPQVVSGGGRIPEDDPIDTETTLL